MLKFGQPRREEPLPKAGPALEPPVARTPLPAPAHDARHVEDSQMSMTGRKDAESVLAAGITIEGKIEGNGNVRVVGRFKGTVNVKGELTIEPGASIEGEIRAESVLVAGEVPGADHRRVPGGAQRLRHADRGREGGQRDGLRWFQDAWEDGVRVEGGRRRAPKQPQRTVAASS